MILQAGLLGITASCNSTSVIPNLHCMRLSSTAHFAEGSKLHAWQHHSVWMFCCRWEW